MSGSEPTPSAIDAERRKLIDAAERLRAVSADCLSDRQAELRVWRPGDHADAPFRDRQRKAVRALLDVVRPTLKAAYLATEPIDELLEHLEGAALTRPQRLALRDDVGEVLRRLVEMLRDADGFGDAFLARRLKLAREQARRAGGKRGLTPDEWRRVVKERDSRRDRGERKVNERIAGALRRGEFPGIPRAVDIEADTIRRKRL